MAKDGATLADRHEASADATRARIVAAAADLFAEQSFDGATNGRSRRAPG